MKIKGISNNNSKNCKQWKDCSVGKDLAYRR